MRVRNALLGALVAALAASSLPAGAQIRRVRPDRDEASRAVRSGEGDVRTLLGMSVSLTGSDRDTLGMLVSSVAPDGPADKARIDPGNRIGEINGASLRVYPGDVGDRDASDAVMRRLERELGRVRPGDDVTLRVFASGRYRNVTLQAAGATAETSGTVTATAPSEDTRPPTIDGVLEAMGQLQAQLRRLSQDEGSGALTDTLAQAEREIAALRRRLRAAIVERRRPTARDDDRDARAQGGDRVPGLRVTTVSEDLAAYFGDGSERGLLVLQADSSWAPLRSGDVIVRVDGEPVDMSRLRDAADPGHETTVDVLRRRRLLVLTLHPRD
jgi:S1-C subfamily serine protease